MGSNRTTLGKRFQRTLRMSLHEYLLRRRIAYASERASLGDGKVDSVAADCGFSSASYFSRVFTQITAAVPVRCGPPRGRARPLDGSGGENQKPAACWRGPPVS